MLVFDAFQWFFTDDQSARENMQPQLTHADSNECTILAQPSFLCTLLVLRWQDRAAPAPERGGKQ